MKIGVISDTHGHLDRRVFGLFDGVDHILHAGDIGYPSLILELEAIAPVTATRFEPTSPVLPPITSCGV